MFTITLFLLLHFRESESYVDNTNKDRILGGYRCSILKHSYLVGIIYENKKLICGGTLLSENWVLTSKHCFASDCNRPGVYKVVAGLDDPRQYQSESSIAQASLVESCYPHDSYNIGLMKLMQSINISPTVTFVRLATYLDYLNRDFEAFCNESLVMGWGLQAPRMKLNKTLVPGEYEKYDPNLHCMNLSVISNSVCSEKLQSIKKNKVEDPYFCAFNKDSNACWGDSGGPLVCHGIQYGIMSIGHGCVYKHLPGLYIKTGLLESFIKYTITNTRRNIKPKRSGGSSNVNVFWTWPAAFVLVVLILIKLCRI